MKFFNTTIIYDHGLGLKLLQYMPLISKLMNHCLYAYAQKGTIDLLCCPELPLFFLNFA